MKLLEQIIVVLAYALPVIFMTWLAIQLAVMFTN
jgi:hypothetical protein